MSFGETVESFMVDPIASVRGSYTELHSIPRRDLQDIQCKWAAERFAAVAGQVPFVNAIVRDRVKPDGGVEFLLPLLLDHRTYKSYDASCVPEGDFGRLSSWLDQLVCERVDVEAASRAASLDDWLTLLATESALDVSRTNGTSGKMSFFPWTRSELSFRARANHASELQRYGVRADELLLEVPYHYLARPSRTRWNYYDEAVTHGAPGHTHLRGASRPSADLLWLSAMLRIESLSEIPDSLMARREELEAYEHASVAAEDRWLEEVRGLTGQRVLWVSHPHDVYSLAERFRGEYWDFHSSSVLVLAGGSKGHELPAGWLDTIRAFTSARPVQAYGMTEMSCLNFQCDEGRYHLQPWIIPFVLNPDTNEAMPRSGVQTGRFAFFDLMVEGHWGGLVTGDEVEIDFDRDCACGATSLHLGPRIERLSMRRGGDDKVAEMSSPGAYAAALELLRGSAARPA